MEPTGEYHTAAILLNSKGFTLVETICVLIIIGVLSAVALSKMDSTGAYDVAMESERLKAHLRYSQIRAMTDNQTWGIRISGGNAYTLEKNGSTALIHLPNENAATRFLSAGISATPTTATITFDDLGNPGDTDIVITLRQQGKNPRKLSITAKTGFIH